MMSTKQLRILVFSDWFLPGYRAGGPIRSLANLVNALPHQFYIVTSNKDHHSNEAYLGIASNTWIKHAENVNVMYLSDDTISSATFTALIKELNADKIYFNSLFSPRFTITPLRAVRKLHLQSQVILAPRGMLKPGALSIKSNKKKLFLLYAKLIGLYKGITWHATNADEVNEIKLQFTAATDIRFAPNLPSMPVIRPLKLEKKSGELKLICIARISPEKGILEAIQFLKAAQLDGNVSCDFYGTQQNADYLEECEKLAITVPLVSISFKGEIEPEKIPEAFSHYHFFYMTTWGENFGHAIAEALNNATPVLISNKTPWQDLATQYAGWDLPLKEEDFAGQLNYLLRMNKEEYAKWSEGAYQLGQRTAHNPALIEASVRLFS